MTPHKRDERLTFTAATRHARLRSDDLLSGAPIGFHLVRLFALKELMDGAPPLCDFIRRDGCCCQYNNHIQRIVHWYSSSTTRSWTPVGEQVWERAAQELDFLSNCVLAPVELVQKLVEACAIPVIPFGGYLR